MGEIGIINTNHSISWEHYDNAGTTNVYAGTNDVDLSYWKDKLDFISFHVILPIFVIVGLAVNAVAFCIWVFGSKSKSMCCAVYFAANSTVDFILLIAPLVWIDQWGYIVIQKTDFTCKLVLSLNNSCLNLSTWISAIITVERSLTILFPFVFKLQSMRERSKVVVIVLIVLQPFVQFVPLLEIEMAKNTCIFTKYSLEYNFVFFIVCILIPFVVILTFNVATVATLIRQRFRRQPVAGRQDHVHAFTKLTLFTGVSFVLSYTLAALQIIYIITFGADKKAHFYVLSFYVLDRLSKTMVYLNNIMNPIFCFIVWKSVRDDIKQFLSSAAQLIRRVCTCRRSQHETHTPNVIVEQIGVTPNIVDTGADLNVATTSV